MPLDPDTLVNAHLYQPLASQGRQKEFHTSILGYVDGDFVRGRDEAIYMPLSMVRQIEPVLYHGNDGYSATNYHRVMTFGEGPQGATDNFWVSALFTIKDTITGSGGRIFGHSNGVGGDGGFVMYTSSAPRLNFLVQTSAGNQITFFNIAGHAGRTFLATVQYSGSALALFINGVLRHSPPTIGTYQPPALYNFSVGNSGNSTAPATNVTVHGIASGEGSAQAITSAIAGAHFDNVQQNAKMVEIVGSTSYLWSLEPSLGDHDSHVTDPVWVEEKGTGDDLFVTGTLSHTEVAPIFWSP